jgi:predicted Zn-dependent protease
MGGTDLFSRDEARALAQRVLGFSVAEQARVRLSGTREGNTRFAENQVTTAGDVADAEVLVTSAFGRRVASARTNRLDDESLRRVVAMSEQLARLVPENPEYLDELGPQTYTAPTAHFASTAGLGPAERAAAVAQIARRVHERGLVGTGFLPFEARARAVATSRGLFAHTTSTLANLTLTVRTPDGAGSGWAGTSAHDWSAVDPAALAEEAIHKAERSRDAQPVEPGEWTVILEPRAVADMVDLLVRALDARRADEGRSAFSRAGGGTLVGERVFDERVRLHSDPADPLLFTSPFNDEGLPNTRMEWVDGGVLRNLTHSRYWAERQGRPPAGFISGYYMGGGDSTIEEMIASTERGLLVTRLWYIRSVDPRTLLYTGLTRDGTFLIEGGRITRAAKNMRWNESPMFILNNLEMMGRPTRVANDSGGTGPSVVVPPLKVRGFTFTSISDAV